VIIGAAIEVHRVLGGPGLLEDVYEEALCHELQLRGLSVERQVPVALEYKGKLLRKQLVLDLLVNDLVIVEVKDRRNLQRHLPSAASDLSATNQKAARTRDQLWREVCQR